ncbi:MAG: hypothetical protein K2M95_03810 [Clostridiales bacterium]|nr:hypothetical protein [Clostridiales bacterium]
MDKYDGMNKVETTVRQNSEVQPEKPRKKRGVPVFFKQLLLAGVCALVLFACSRFGVLQGALQKVKEAVSFDATVYLRALAEKIG